MSCAHPRCTDDPMSGSVYVVDDIEVEIRACPDHFNDVAAAFDGGVDSEAVEVYR